jgi:hypothetical protein
LLVAVVDPPPTSWTSPPPVRRDEGAADAAQTLRLPLACHLCHPRPRASSLTPTTPSIITKGEQRGGCVCVVVVGRGGGATWPPRLPPTPRRSSAALPHRRARVAPPCSAIAPSESFSRQGGSRGAVESTWPPSSPPAPRCPHTDHPLHHLTYEPGQHRLALQQHYMSQTYMHLVAPTPDPTMALMHPRSTILDLS